MTTLDSLRQSLNFSGSGCKGAFEAAAAAKERFRRDGRYHRQERHHQAWSRQLPYWSVQTKCWLGSKDLFRWIKQKPAAGEDSVVSAADRAADSKALYIIGMTLTEEHYTLFEECETAMEAWEALANLFKNKSQARRLQLKTEMSNLRMETGESLTKYFARAKRLKSQLASVGTQVPDDELALTVLAGLPDEYAMIRKIMVNTDKALSMDEVLPKLMMDETSHDKPQSGTKAYVAKPGSGHAPRRQAGAPYTFSKKPKEDRKCHHCGKPGHFKKDCWKRQREEQGSSSSHGHKPAWSSGNGFKGGQGNIACAAYRPHEKMEAWILDSGASRHIATSQESMTNVRTVPADTTITFGNGEQAAVEAVGDVTLRVPGSDFRSLTLTDVWHVPRATMNLFSIKSAVRRGIEVVFSHDNSGEICTMRKDGKLLARGDARTGIFGMVGHHVPAASVALSATETPQLWHRRYGHLGYDNLAKLAETGLVKGMTTSAAEFKTAGKDACGTCITSKQHKIARPSSSSDSQRPLELLHTDVCGPLEEPSLGGCVYLVTYLDDHSKMAIVRTVARKSDVPELTKHVILFMEKQSGHDLLVLRSDNGTEYVNRRLAEFLKSKGVLHQTTVRYTPEQDGAAERLNRTLMERVRAMLEDSGLPKPYWGEAACTAAYIRNRSPVQGRTKVPWELFFNREA